MDEDDLYGDLTEALIQPLDKDVENRRQDEEKRLEENRELKEKLKQKDEELNELRKSYERLNTNASFLMETAKTEVTR